MKNAKKWCDGSTSWNCCFSRDSKILVKKNDQCLEKSIYEIKKDDLNIQKNMMMNLNFMNLNV